MFDADLFQPWEPPVVNAGKRNFEISLFPSTGIDFIIVKCCVSAFIIRDKKRMTSLNVFERLTEPENEHQNVNISDQSGSRK
ncbi:hypothetical protein GCM10008943_26950 [Paenochrobactrum glaciei]|uniref:Uncharacterized protein n=1 Tax=Paenochrobactrum glaciei TaxID=486407 RepID=A0ABP3RG60_9HYPH